MPPSTTFHLIRHAEVLNPGGLVYGSLPNFGLSELGARQAVEAAEHLAGRPLAAVWSSPLERALRTAEIIAARHRLVVLVDEALIEWRLADRWAGLPWEDLPRVRPGELEAYLSDPTNLPFSPESLEVLAKRVAAVVGRLVDRYRGTEFAVVTHQDPLQAGRLQLLGKPLTGLASNKPVHGAVLTFQTAMDRCRELPGWRPAETVHFPPAPQGP